MKILEYQKLDAELVALEKKVDNSAEHEVLNKMSALVKELQQKLIGLEKEAEKLNKDYEETHASYEKNLEGVKKLTDIKSETLAEEKLNVALSEANKLSSNLFMLERKLNQIVVNIQNTLKEFELTKNKTMSARAKHAEAKASLDKIISEVEPKKESILKELKKMEAGIDVKILEKYKSLKHDNVFPAFVPLSENRCGYCRVELPSSKLDEIKNKEHITCEQCRRIIFKI